LIDRLENGAGSRIGTQSAMYSNGGYVVIAVRHGESPFDV
jgi:hypothetical protein